VIFRRVSMGAERGLEIVFVDQGPGIGDTEQSLRDGYSTTGSLGIGLSGAKRMMDELEIESELGKGTAVWTRKWLWAVKSLSMQFGVVKRALKGQAACGDAYFIKEFANRVLIGVVDGLGHGPDAAAAAETAVEYIGNNYRKSLTEIIRGCHEKLKETRGIVAGIALIDQGRSILRYTGVGNIAIRVRSRTRIRPVSVNGILGHNLRKVREEEYPYNPGDMIILHSDGISRKFYMKLYPPEFFRRHPQGIAERIAAEFGRESDDLTIVVAR